MWIWLYFTAISYHLIPAVLPFPQPSKNNSGSTFKCTGTGLESDSTDCSKYHQCLLEGQGPLATVSCPPNALFDSLEKNCRPKATANCITCKEDGFFKDNASPYYYIECHGGLAEKHPCEPSGSTFNMEEQGCEMPEEDSKPAIRDFPGANNFGYKVHHQGSAFLHPSLKALDGMISRSMSVATFAQAGPVKALASARTRNGSEDGGYAHSQASIGAEKTNDQVFKGLGTMGGEYSNIHAMATATGTGKIKEQVKTSDEEESSEKPEFDISPDSIKLGPNKEQVSDDETARTRREIQIERGKSIPNLPNVHFKHLYGPRALENQEEAEEGEELDEKDWGLDNFNSELRVLAERLNDSKPHRNISRTLSEISPSEETVISRNLPGAPVDAPNYNATGKSDRKISFNAGRQANNTQQGKSASQTTKAPVAQTGKKVVPVAQQGRSAIDKTGRKIGKGEGDTKSGEEVPPVPPPPPPTAPPEVQLPQTTLPHKPHVKKPRYKVVRVPCRVKGAAGNKSGRGMPPKIPSKPPGIYGGRRVFGINRNITYPTEPPTKQPFKGGRMVMGVKKNVSYPTEPPEDPTEKIPVESLTQENDTNKDYILSDGSDTHDDPTKVLHAKPLITLTGDEIDQTVQIHGSFVDGGDNSIPIQNHGDDNLNDVIDATATEKIYILKKDGGSQVVSHHIKIGSGSHNKEYLKLNEQIDKERAENISQKGHIEYWINDAHMTVSKTKDSQIYRYYGPITVTNVTQGQRKPAGIIPEYVGAAHSSGGNGPNTDDPESQQNLIKIVVSGIHGNRKKAKKIYKVSKGGYEKPRWASSLAIAGTSSITGGGGGSVAGAHAQDADPNSRTKAEASGATWSGGSQAVSTSFADSKSVHGTQTVCLNPPCKSETSDTAAVAGKWKVEGASGTGIIAHDTKEVIDIKSGDPNTKPDYSLKTPSKNSLGKKVKVVSGGPQMNLNEGSQVASQITQESERLEAYPNRPRKKLVRKLKAKGQAHQDADGSEPTGNQGAIVQKQVRRPVESNSETVPLRKRKKINRNGPGQKDNDEEANGAEPSGSKQTVIRRVVKDQEEISENRPLRKRKKKIKNGQRDHDEEIDDEESTANEGTFRRKVTMKVEEEETSGTRPLRKKKKIIRNGQRQKDEETDNTDQTGNERPVIRKNTNNQEEVTSDSGPPRGRKKLIRKLQHQGEGSSVTKQVENEETDDDSERSKRYRGVQRPRKLKRPTNKRPAPQKKKDPFAFEWDGGNRKSMGGMDDSPFEHSIASAAQNFGGGHEWKTGKEDPLSDHAGTPVSYQKTFGSSNSSSFKKGLTKNRNGNNSFTAGTSQTVAKKQEFATDERLGSKKHMKKEQLKDIAEKVSSHTGADGQHRNFTDTQHGHYEKTNISEFDHHTGETMGSLHEKELKHGNTTNLAKSADGNYRYDYTAKKKGFEKKNSSFTGDDIEHAENIDKKIEAEKIIAHEGNATSERRAESDKTVRAESHAKFSNDSGVEEHLSNSNTLSADAQSKYARDGTEERGHSSNNTYLTDTRASKNATDELEESLSHQKVRGSESSMSFTNVNGSKKIDELSTIIGSDTSSASNKTWDQEHLVNLQTSFAKHKDRQGTEENLGNNVTQSKYVTNEDNDASQKVILVHRVNNEDGEPESEKVSQHQKSKSDWSKTNLDVYNDTNSNFSSSVQSESGNSSSSNSGSEKFSVLSEEGKLKEEYARARTKHKKTVGPPGSETVIYEYDEEPEVHGGSPYVQKVPKKEHIEVVYADDAEDYKSPSGARHKIGQNSHPPKSSSKTHEYEEEDPHPIKTPPVETKTKEGSVALAYAGGGYKDGEKTAISGSHTIGSDSESGALAGAGNGGAKAVVSLKQYPKTETRKATEVEYVYER